MKIESWKERAPKTSARLFLLQALQPQLLGTLTVQPPPYRHLRTLGFSESCSPSSCVSCSLTSASLDLLPSLRLTALVRLCWTFPRLSDALIDSQHVFKFFERRSASRVDLQLPPHPTTTHHHL